ncbi:unnamed protein product [Caenorhabditis nigoni]
MRIVILLAFFVLGCLAADHEKSLQFDVVFLIDGSQSARPVFDNFTNFVGDLMAPYNVSMNGARVGIIVVNADLDVQPPPAANLNSLPAQANLISVLRILKDEYADFDYAGQLLNYNLQLVSSVQFMSPNAGYRTGIHNHLLVYITSTTSFDTDPVTTAQSIIKLKQYGIITVGVGEDIDPNKLNAISGGSPCTFLAKTSAELNDVIKPIQRHIMFADAHNGNYCHKK